MLAKTVYKEVTQTCQLYQLIQRALVQQVLEAIETNYLNSIWSRVTGQGPAEIRTLIFHIFWVYGKITPQQLRAKQEAVRKMEYQKQESITIIFGAVEDLAEIEELAGRPYSPDQIVDIGYIVLIKNIIFRSNIRKWMRRPDFKKTWPNMKQFHWSSSRATWCRRHSWQTRDPLCKFHSYTDCRTTTRQGSPRQHKPFHRFLYDFSPGLTPETLSHPMNNSPDLGMEISNATQTIDLAMDIFLETMMSNIEA